MSDNSFRSRAHLTKASIGFGWRLRYSKIWEFMFIFWKQKFVAKKNFFLKTIFFEQSILSEVGLVKIWKGTDQYNLSNETFKHGRKMIKNVSFLARLRWDRSYQRISLGGNLLCFITRKKKYFFFGTDIWSDGIVSKLLQNDSPGTGDEL